MVDPEVIRTAATTIAVIFLTEALKKSGQIFGESLLKATGKAIANLRIQAPDLAKAIECRFNTIGGQSRFCRGDRGG